MGRLRSAATLQRQKIFDALARMRETQEAVYVNVRGSRLKVRPYTDDDDPAYGLRVLFYLRPGTRIHFGEMTSVGRWPLRLATTERYRDGSKRPTRTIPEENILGVVEETYDVASREHE